MFLDSCKVFGMNFKSNPLFLNLIFPVLLIIQLILLVVFFISIIIFIISIIRKRNVRYRFINIFKFLLIFIIFTLSSIAFEKITKASIISYGQYNCDKCIIKKGCFNLNYQTYKNIDKDNVNHSCHASCQKLIDIDYIVMILDIGFIFLLIFTSRKLKKYKPIQE